MPISAQKDATAGFYTSWSRECTIARAFDGAKIAIREGNTKELDFNVEILKQLKFEMIGELRAGGSETDSMQRSQYAYGIKELAKELKPVVEKLKDDVRNSENTDSVKSVMLQRLDSLRLDVLKESVHAIRDISRKTL